MFNNVILKVTKMRRTLLALALLGGSLAIHADREDSLQSYNYFFLEAIRQQEMATLRLLSTFCAMHATSIHKLQKFIISWLLFMWI